MTITSKKRKFDPRLIHITSTSAKHPLNVKPQGNALLGVASSRNYGDRQSQLGLLAKVDDETIMEILSRVDDIASLRNVAATSRFLYAFLYDEDFWRKYYMKMKPGLVWKGSWRRSILNIDEEAQIQIYDAMFCSDLLYRPFQVAQTDYMHLFQNLVESEQHNKDEGFNPQDRIPRFREDYVSTDRFNTELYNSPFILTSEKGRWPSWTLEHLGKEYPKVKFTQESVHWTLDLFLQYLESNQDESPLYLFDCNSRAMSDLRAEYESPELFKQDYFKYFRYKEVNCRPDNSWIIIGGKRSGSTFHKDPNSTCAWNTVIQGKKLWVMLPPNVTPPGVIMSDDESEVTSPIGIGEWILSGFYQDVLKIPEALIGVSFPGECLYVPAGWWHLVINLEDSIALTENFVPKPTLPRVLNFFKNKSGQISGFKLNEIKTVIDAILPDIPRTSSEKTPIHQILSEFSQHINDLDINTHEDCGEIEDLPPIPVFELFQQLLLLNDKTEDLESALKQLEELESKTSKWQKLTSSTGGFAFNFNEDDE